MTPKVDNFDKIKIKVAELIPETKDPDEFLAESHDWVEETKEI